MVTVSCDSWQTVYIYEWLAVEVRSAIFAYFTTRGKQFTQAVQVRSTIFTPFTTHGKRTVL